MVELVAKSPAGGLLPIDIGGARAEEIVGGTLIWFSNWDEAGAAAVGAALGVGMPEPGRVAEGPGGRLAWVGLDQALWIGGMVGIPDGVAAMDQSDAWCLARLSGSGGRGAPGASNRSERDGARDDSGRGPPGAVRDVLARLVPVDPSEIVPGRVVRTELGHMQSILIGCADGSVDVAVFRSMAGTLARDLKEAMTAVAARGMMN